MLLLLSGPDSYRRLREKNRLIQGSRAKYPGLGVAEFFFGGNEKPFSEAIDFLRGQSLFSPVRLAILENSMACEPPKDFLANLPSFALSKNAHLILIEDKKPVAKILNSLGDNLMHSEFGSLSGSAWLELIRSESEVRGVRLSPSALSFIATLHPGDSWWLATELDRLAGMPDKNISLESLASLHSEVAPDFGSAMRALSGGGVGARLIALEKLLVREPAGKIFNILTGWAKTKTPLFAAYDLQVKSGRFDYEEALLDFSIS